ncbi:tRNA A64-2'-O-ribosylphosphate transferase [Kickxella alabastrina]|uniref:tRNA A64-2'-O-ribosylphosphate transferase n=1 Tax=Kickxella alabastrina TaxID=61397 RepID=UPI00221E4226|nr:tRNA A64-2'-O-ribosylphosphate transferase [Kickxella alabastrina]KAI7831072.1 tRNA A64-2'-O-ribosylphosphate transferase [Kickxella alabastrina]
MSDCKLDTYSNSIHKIGDQLRREARSTYNRLRSIDDDAGFVRNVSELLPSYPVIANERCGLWYVDPSVAHAQTVYFKSTDGHNGNWKFSLRRANTQLFNVLRQYSGCLIVDSTRQGKRMPDSFSRTIPIWCAVWNMARSLVEGLQPETGVTEVHVPPSIVSPSERSQINKLVPGFAKSLVESGIDVQGLLQGISKPLRPIWITQDHSLFMPPDFTDANFIPIVCVCASAVLFNDQRVEASFGRSAYLYVQGSADDHELWAQGLTARLFWKHRRQLLENKDTCLDVAQSIVLRERQSEGDDDLGACGKFNFVAHTNIAVGGRVGGRPPECWSQFDAVINCGSPEYEPNKDRALESQYLFLSIPEGKRGQVELGRSIPQALEFVRSFVGDPQKRILVHCSQGVDRSVGITLSILAKYYDGKGHYCENTSKDITKDSIKTRLLWITTSRTKANPSRATLKQVNRFFLDIV